MNVSPAAALTLTASPSSVASGGTSTLTWSSTNTTSCTATGAWSGAKATSGSFSTPAITAASNYVLTCTGVGGSVSRTASISITATTGAPTIASVSKQGPYTVQTYTAGVSLKSGLFTSPTVYYPTNATPPYPGVVFIPGNNDDYREDPNTTPQWGTLLASHGFVVMFINPTNLGALPAARGTVLISGVDALVGEATRAGSPLLGKLDVTSMAVMGHSYGGAGALYAANTNDPRLKAAIGLNPVTGSPSYSNNRVPSLIIAGYGDPYVADTMQQYNSIPSSTPKLHAEFAKTSDVLYDMHCVALTPIGPLATHKNDPIVTRIGVSFLQVYLKGDKRYEQFLVTDPNMYQREAGGDMFRYNNP